MTVPYKVKSIKDNIAIGVIGDIEKEFKIELVDDKLKQGDFFLAQNGYVLQKLPKQDADNLMKLFT